MNTSSHLRINCCPVRPTTTPTSTPTPTPTQTPTPTPTPTPSPTPPPAPPAPITYDDYLIIFADEALFPSAAGVSGYVWQGPPVLLPNGTPSILGEPNDEWIQDIDNFKALLEYDSIDLNKILIFHTYSGYGNLLPLFPTVNVPPGYEMPIATARIVSPTPRAGYPLPGGQTLTGQWILDKVNEKLNPIIQTGTKKTRIFIFVDDSPSLGFSSVSSGINSFINLASPSFDFPLVLCSTERYLRWIASIFAGNPICS